MSDNTTLDAAILHVVNQQRLEAGFEPLLELGYIGETRKFVGGIIAKLLEGMEQEAVFARSYQHGYNDALTEIRRRAGIEGDKA
jgi:hypothetical protein